ncbi:MAG: hypothetical protein HY812_10855 [Planctomycetes bacterium]|nr:hypothetical protein [Planctomycetota bacterium]
MKFVPLLLALLALHSAPAAAGVSYRSVTSEKDAAAFYRSGGRSFLNQRVHLHVPASCFHKKPARIVQSKGGGQYHVFENRSVPLIVSPRNVYFRKILQRSGKGDTVCVKGIVRNEPLSGKGRFAVFVTTLKKAPAKD